MNFLELKQFIIDNNKIPEILQNLGCHGIKELNKDYRAGLPQSSNTTNISVNKDTLSARIFTSEGKIVRGDILTLVMHIKELKLFDASKLIHKILGLDFKLDHKKKKEEIQKTDPLQIFKKIKRTKNYCNVNDLEIYNEEILSDYIPLPHISWIREGIMPWTCEEFKIGFSPKHKRIIIPVRHWCGESNTYLGIIGRTVVEEFSLLDIPKYLAIKPFARSLNLYGLQENYRHIQEAGYCSVVEAEKSVLKRHSKNDKTFVAVGGHDISDEQVKILISLNVDIIIQMDKDVSLEHIRYLCEKFYKIRNVYYVYDKYNLLKEKDSPADATNKIYNYLFKYKIKYDELEHFKYIKWKEEEDEKNKSGIRAN